MLIKKRYFLGFSRSHFQKIYMDVHFCKDSNKASRNTSPICLSEKLGIFKFRRIILYNFFKKNSSLNPFTLTYLHFPLLYRVFFGWQRSDARCLLFPSSKWKPNVDRWWCRLCGQVQCPGKCRCVCLPPFCFECRSNTQSNTNTDTHNQGPNPWHGKAPDFWARNEQLCKSRRGAPPTPTRYLNFLCFFCRVFVFLFFLFI